MSFSFTPRPADVSCLDVTTAGWDMPVASGTVGIRSLLFPLLVVAWCSWTSLYGRQWLILSWGGSCEAWPSDMFPSSFACDALEGVVLCSWFSWLGACLAMLVGAMDVWPHLFLLVTNAMCTFISSNPRFGVDPKFCFRCTVDDVYLARCALPVMILRIAVRPACTVCHLGSYAPCSFFHNRECGSF